MLSNQGAQQWGFLLNFQAQYAKEIKLASNQISFEIRFESSFNRLFRSKFLKSDQIVGMKLIISCPIYIEQVDLYQK